MRTVCCVSWKLLRRDGILGMGGGGGTGCVDALEGVGSDQKKCPNGGIVGNGCRQ